MKIAEALDRFVAGFNDDDLDRVMQFDVDDRTLYGRRAGWYGMDVFHFDDAGKIVGKFSYANYHLPRLRRDLGKREGNAWCPPERSCSTSARTSAR
jgi:hypothetical protein